MMDNMFNFLKNSWISFKGRSNYKWVVVATLLVFVYNQFLASKRYVPEVNLIIKSAKPVSAVPALGGLSFLAGLGAGSPDLALLQAFIHSKDMLRKTDAALRLKDHYSDERWDIISRLPSWASDEDFHEYFVNHVTLIPDLESNILTVQAEGFTRDFSHKLTNFILDEAETFINDIGQLLAKKEIEFMEQEMQRAKINFEVAREKMLDFIAENKTISPAAKTQAFQSAILRLRGQLFNLEAEKKVMLSFLNADAPELLRLEARMEALREQIEIQESKIEGEESQNLVATNHEYEDLVTQLGFFEKIYTKSVATLEQTKVDAYHKIKHVVVVQSSVIPDDDTYPRVLYNTITFFVLASIAFGIFSMVTASMKEHKDV